MAEFLASSSSSHERVSTGPFQPVPLPSVPTLGAALSPHPTSTSETAQITGKYALLAQSNVERALLDHLNEQAQELSTVKDRLKTLETNYGSICDICENNEECLVFSLRTISVIASALTAEADIYKDIAGAEDCFQRMTLCAKIANGTMNAVVGLEKKEEVVLDDGGAFDEMRQLISQQAESKEKRRRLMQLDALEDAGKKRAAAKLAKQAGGTRLKAVRGTDDGGAEMVAAEETFEAAVPQTTGLQPDMSSIIDSCGFLVVRGLLRSSGCMVMLADDDTQDLPLPDELVTAARVDMNKRSTQEIRTVDHREMGYSMALFVTSVIRNVTVCKGRSHPIIVAGFDPKQKDKEADNVFLDRLSPVVKKLLDLAAPNVGLSDDFPEKFKTAALLVCVSALANSTAKLLEKGKPSRKGSQPDDLTLEKAAKQKKTKNGAASANSK